MTPHEPGTGTMSLDRLKELAATVAGELQSAAANDDRLPAAGGGSRPRGLPEELRVRFITVRAALFARGIYDPVLVRFDSATSAPALTSDIAEQLALVANAL